MKLPSDPASRFYQSQDLRLHYVDWGNDAAPPLILVHGGGDQCRSWDWVARSLQPHFHVIAPDLRGHGDSEWARASSYSLSDNIYGLTRLIRAAKVEKPVMVAHSMGGMISLAYAGTFPDQVSRLAVLDGMFLPPASVKSIGQQIAEWIAQLDKIAEHEVHRFRSVADAMQRILQRNARLTQAQALHLASHAVRKNTDASYSWKFDPHHRARAPYRLSAEQYTALWSRITCPVLLLHGNESFLPDPVASGLVAHIAHAESRTIVGAGHWLQHDKLDEVLDELHRFLGLSG